MHQLQDRWSFKAHIPETSSLQAHGPLSGVKCETLASVSSRRLIIGIPFGSLVERIVMSNEELKIRGELETDVERDLETEIKDGIYHLALRLHRLYQHQNERNESRKNHSQGLTSKKTLCEVNINIKMEGGTKIEIKEIKKDMEAQPRPSSRSENSKNMQGMVGSSAKRFDWVKSLRSEARPPVINKKNIDAKARVMISYDQHVLHNQTHKPDRVRRNWSGSSTSASQQHKGTLRVENKLLELGWKF